MAFRLCVGLCMAYLLAPVGAESLKITPVQKVIEMMNDMVEQGTKEKQDEQVQFASFKSFCDSTVKNKKRAIEEAEEMIKMHTADNAKYTTEAAELKKAIAAHDADISTWEGDLQAATKVRAIENTEYLKLKSDYDSSIDAVDDGIAQLTAQQGDVKQAAASLMQMQKIPAKSKKLIYAFLNEGSKASAPEANAYESQTTGLTDMLTGLGGKFKDELAVEDKKEVESKHAFEMLAQDLRAQLDSATSARTEKAEAKAAALQSSAEAKAGLADTKGTKEADTKYVTDLITTCEEKSADFANRQELRAEEIVAVEKAIEILSSGKVAGASEKNLPQLVQTRSALAQLRTAEGHHGPHHLQFRVAAYLKSQAVKLNSRVLSALATRVTADPFKKVKKMIKDLIVKLIEEAGAEAEQKGWCDTEMGTNKKTRESKTQEIEMLYARIDELEASVAQLTAQTAELTTTLAELDAAVAKATNIRNAERAKNTQVITESKEAQEAVGKALTVLNEFYAKAAEATSFLQGRVREPEIFGDEPYKGMGGESGGVVGMIEVIQSDFARLETETSAAEEAAASEYAEFMKDSKIDKAEKGMDLKHQSSTKQDHEQALQEAIASRDGTQKELDAALAYYEKLKPTCVETGVSFEDRVQRRKEEMESLQTALRVLNNEDVL